MILLVPKIAFRTGYQGILHMFLDAESSFLEFCWAMNSKLLISVYIYKRLLGLALIWAKYFWGSFMNNCFNTFCLSPSFNFFLELSFGVRPSTLWRNSLS